MRRAGGGETNLGTAKRVNKKEERVVQRARGKGRRRAVWGATCVRRALA